MYVCMHVCICLNLFLQITDYSLQFAHVHMNVCIHSNSQIVYYIVLRKIKFDFDSCTFLPPVGDEFSSLVLSVLNVCVCVYK